MLLVSILYETIPYKKLEPLRYNLLHASAWIGSFSYPP